MNTNTNTGTVDRIARVVIAAVAAVGAALIGFGSIAGVVLLIVATLMLGTAAVGFCPAYRLFGISTCRVAPARGPERVPTR